MRQTSGIPKLLESRPSQMLLSWAPFLEKEGGVVPQWPISRINPGHKWWGGRGNKKVRGKWAPCFSHFLAPLPLSPLFLLHRLGSTSLCQTWPVSLVLTVFLWTTLTKIPKGTPLGLPHLWFKGFDSVVVNWRDNISSSSFCAVHSFWVLFTFQNFPSEIFSKLI